MTKFSALFLATFSTVISFAAQGKSIEFNARTHVWDCPAGYQYPVLQCTDHETDLGTQKLEMEDAGDGFWAASLDVKGVGALTSVNHLSVMLFPHEDGTIYMNLDMTSGFDPVWQRNPGTFFEAKPAPFPEWMLVTGEHRAKGTREILAEFEYRDLKVSP